MSVCQARGKRRGGACLTPIAWIGRNGTNRAFEKKYEYLKGMLLVRKHLFLRRRWGARALGAFMIFLGGGTTAKPRSPRLGLRLTLRFSYDRLYFVAFTVRGDAIRIISMRKANKREERQYVQT